MLKVKVLKRYRDKETLVLHGKNTEVEMTKERFDEIALSGLFVEEIKAADKKKKVR